MNPLNIERRQGLWTVVPEQAVTVDPEQGKAQLGVEGQVSKGDMAL